MFVNLNGRVLLEVSNRRKLNFIIELGVEKIEKAQTRHFGFGSAF
jgi:hypothetical protein